MVKVKCKRCNKIFEVGESIIKNGKGKYCSIKCQHGEKIKKICLICNKNFEVTPFWKDAKYCSRKCCTKSQMNRIKIICKYCKKEYEVKYSRKNKSKFCSKKCRINYETGKKRSRVNIVCKGCGKVFEVLKYRKDNSKYLAKYCSMSCKNKNSEYWNKYISTNVIKFCLICGKQFEVKKYRKDNSSYCSLKCYHKSLVGIKKSEEFKNKIRGKNSPNWKGGTRRLNNRIHDRTNYSEWRIKVFERDNFLCQMPECNKIERYLNAHHIIKKSTILSKHNIKTLEDAENCKELWDINNGITLCEKCHNKIRNHEKNYESLFKEIVALKLK